MPRPENEDERRRRRDEQLIDVEELRSCFDEGCDLVIDGQGRVVARDGSEANDESLQVLSKLRRWFEEV